MALFLMVFVGMIMFLVSLFTMDTRDPNKVMVSGASKTLPPLILTASFAE